ncbi:hypothetical protein CGCFRS4_v003842 [Colletotrichum fructicola]|uniref:Uncharacterized protein n=1 Tax=Colletotrichum fructicola (strain Nara gc5) TaxID=1213859 RepID=L2G264_COLFN|nr:hypothetical protein CGCFRS4_v003842 [Colletotrichum fructicola]
MGKRKTWPMKTVGGIAEVCKVLISKRKLPQKDSERLTLENLSALSSALSRRGGPDQYSMGRRTIPEAVVAVRAHSPHQLSMIEEASRESTPMIATGANADVSADHLHNYPTEDITYEKFDSSDIIEEYVHQNTEYRFDEGASNVGPLGLGHGDLIQNNADTVLYGNWEQDNNLEDFDRCSTPDTVIHYDMDEMEAACQARSSSPTASCQQSTEKGSSTQNASLKMGSSSRAKDWSMFQSNLVDYGPDDPSPRLPGCSAGHPYNKTWKLTDSMMMAYNAMRGPPLLPGNDPLRNWMAIKATESMNESTMGSTTAESFQTSRETASLGTRSVTQTSPSKDTTQTSGLSSGEKREMEDYAKMLKEANMATKEYAPPETDRNPAYEVPRPRYLHVSPRFNSFKFEDYMHPEVSMPGSAYKQPYDTNRDFAEEYDISDDEGDPESGRVSPCTFRLLSEGCSRRDPQTNQVFMAEDAQRMRPETPLEDNDRHLVVDRLTLSFELQRDINDGGWITPCYSVESEPSIIFSVTLKHKMRNWWFGLFDRMDPIAARRFRKVQFREANDPVTPLETISARSVVSSSTSSDDGIGNYRKSYTDAEVLEALHSPASRRVAGVAPQNAQLIISQRWQTVTRWKNQDAEMTRENDNMRGAIERAKMELREIRLAVDHIVQKKAAEDMAMRQRNHRRILRQVSAHLHELRYEIQSKFDALKHAQTQNQSMKAELALLEWQIKNECARAEMASPDEVRKAVSEHFRDKMIALELADCF